MLKINELVKVCEDLNWFAKNLIHLEANSLIEKIAK